MAVANDTEIRPNHIIVWLDKNMGMKQNNRPSKIDLATNATIDCVPSNERSLDIDNFIRAVDDNMDNEKFYDSDQSSLQMFTNENECINFIDNNIKEKRQSFLVTSGAMGASIVPKIYAKLSNYIYIFCGQRDLHSWTDEYTNHLEVYDDETGLFARILYDIGLYYVQKSDESISDPKSSIQYLRWAQLFVRRASNLDRVNRQALLEYIDEQLVSLESSYSNSSMNNDQMGQAADEG